MYFYEPLKKIKRVSFSELTIHFAENSSAFDILAQKIFPGILIYHWTLIEMFQKGLKTKIKIKKYNNKHTHTKNDFSKRQKLRNSVDTIYLELQETRIFGLRQQVLELSVFEISTIKHLGISMEHYGQNVQKSICK